MFHRKRSSYSFPFAFRKLAEFDGAGDLSPEFAGSADAENGIYPGLTPQALCCRLLRKLKCFFCADARQRAVVLIRSAGPNRRFDESTAMEFDDFIRSN